MNYNYLLYFSVLAETEHYTQAAARLGISQPSLSNAIHNLENDLGGGGVRKFTKIHELFQKFEDLAPAFLHGPLEIFGKVAGAEVFFQLRDIPGIEHCHAFLRTLCPFRR